MHCDFKMPQFLDESLKVRRMGVGGDAGRRWMARGPVSSSGEVQNKTKIKSVSIECL